MQCVGIPMRAVIRRRGHVVTTKRTFRAVTEAQCVCDGPSGSVSLGLALLRVELTSVIMGSAFMSDATGRMDRPGSVGRPLLGETTHGRSSLHDQIR